MKTLSGYFLFTVMVAFMLTFITESMYAAEVVPDNQVWTPATATFFYGQEKANITCKFRGTPYGVYWMKGSTPASADTLVSRINGEISGPRSEDGSLTITSDYSLVFNNIQASDAGNYICRVSNHNGFLIVNNTYVRVLDPEQVKIYTEPSVTGWAGYSVNLPCTFLGSPGRVLWNRVQGDSASKSVETVLRYTSDGFEVLGDRRYSWSDNYGLIISDVRVLDEGNFTCMVSKTGVTDIESTTDLTVNARAVKPYLQIAQCGPKPERATNGTNLPPCEYNVTEDRDSFEISCSAKRVKPAVDIIWQEGSMNLTTTRVVTRRTDGAFDVTATISRSMNQSEFTFTCIASGLAVNGTAQRNVVVRKVKVARPGETGTHPAAIIFIMIFVLALIIISVFILFRAKQYKNRHPDYSECPMDNDTTVESGNNSWIRNKCGNQLLLSKDCVHWVFCGCISGLDGHKNETQQPLKKKETELDLLRDKIRGYQPGDATGEPLGEVPPAIQIGLFGQMCVGKSSLINSLKFALSGTYKNIAVEAENTQGGSSTRFRETISMTNYIQVLDNRGMKDLQTQQIKKDLMPQICGKRGINPEEKIEGGKIVHCPVFVCSYSQVTPLQPILEFIDSFAKKVLDHCGRNVMVVVTHVNTPEKKKEIKEQIHRDTNVPKDYIWPCENYTEANHESNDSKDMEYLTFLEKCLEIAERNVKFVTEKKDEKPVRGSLKDSVKRLFKTDSHSSVI